MDAGSDVSLQWDGLVAPTMSTVEWADCYSCFVYEYETYHSLLNIPGVIDSTIICNRVIRRGLPSCDTCS